jgi:hypothetical protein
MHRLFILRPRTCVCGLALACAIVMTGCGFKPAVAHVKGKVIFKNGAMPKTQVRMIRFEPTESSTAKVRRGASSLIEPDGTFELWSKMPGDGIHVGEYDVTFAVQKGPMDPTSLIPAKYSNRATTPYKNVKVDKDADDLSFEIDLSGGAGATGG